MLGDRVRMQSLRRATPTSSSARWPRAATPAGSRPRAAPRRRVLDAVGLRRWSSSRPSARARARSRSRPRPTRRSSSRRPRWATRSRRSRPGCSRSPTSSSSTRPTGPARNGPPPSCGRCSWPLRAAAAADGSSPQRPRPKRPEVLLATATTGDGVPELLAALDRRRSAPDDESRRGRPPRPGRGAGLGDRRRPVAGAASRRGRRERHARAARRGRGAPPGPVRRRRRADRQGHAVVTGRGRGPARL